MILLGIESATELAGVAVGGGDTGACAWVAGGRRHGESLAPAIEHVLSQCRLAPEDVEAVAVDVGPGLFTGLRVGIATAKGLAQGLGVGVVEVTSLEILARAALDACWPGEVLAVVDARRGEVFAARYAPGDPGAPTVVPVEPPGRWTPADLAAALVRQRDAATGGEPVPVLAVGDGAHRYARELRAVPGVRVAGAALAAPSPQALVTLAAERLAAGARPVAPQDVRPVYLREADARINWSQRATGPTRPD